MQRHRFRCIGLKSSVAIQSVGLEQKIAARGLQDAWLQVHPAQRL